MEKVRLDQFLVARGDCSSREKAVQTIKSGRVLVRGKVISKPSFLVEGEEITVLPAEEYVSRGAFKIKRAYQEFDLSFEGKVVVDIGASTGGFTDFALKKGAKKVYAIDVGKGELAPSLRQDERVVNLEGQDFRLIDKNLCKDANMIIGDLSFISLRHILPKVVELFGKDIEICMLFKPQFECGKEIAKKCKGVIKDKALHKRLLKEFEKFVSENGLNISNLTYSPIKGKSGNIEYLFHINGQNKPFDIDKIVDEAFVSAKKEV